MICRLTINTFLNWTELKFVYYLLTFMFGLLDFHRSLFKEVNYQSRPNESTQVLSKLKTFNINSKIEWNICLSDWGKVQSARLDLLYWIYEMGFVCVCMCVCVCVCVCVRGMTGVFRMSLCFLKSLIITPRTCYQEWIPTNKTLQIC